MMIIILLMSSMMINNNVKILINDMCVIISILMYSNQSMEERLSWRDVNRLYSTKEALKWYWWYNEYIHYDDTMENVCYQYSVEERSVSEEKREKRNIWKKEICDLKEKEMIMQSSPDDSEKPMKRKSNENHDDLATKEKAWLSLWQACGMQACRHFLCILYSAYGCYQHATQHEREKKAAERRRKEKREAKKKNRRRKLPSLTSSYNVYISSYLLLSYVCFLIAIILITQQLITSLMTVMVCAMWAVVWFEPIQWVVIGGDWLVEVRRMTVVGSGDNYSNFEKRSVSSSICFRFCLMAFSWRTDRQTFSSLPVLCLWMTSSPLLSTWHTLHTFFLRNNF